MTVVSPSSLGSCDWLSNKAPIQFELKARELQFQMEAPLPVDSGYAPCQAWMWAWAARARESERERKGEREREHGRGEALRVLHALATITELGGKIPTYTHPFVHINHHKYTLSHSRTSPLQLLSALPLRSSLPFVVLSLLQPIARWSPTSRIGRGGTKLSLSTTTALNSTTTENLCA